MTSARAAEDFDHGDQRRYRRGCRCPKCKAGANARNIRNRYLRQTGRGIQRTPDRAADHVMLLRAGGLDDRDIRKQARVCPDILYRIMRREGTIHVATEKRILAIPVPQHNDGPTKSRAYISGLGTLRRLRTLVAAGWYSAELGRRLGKDRENINQLIKGRNGGKVAMFQADQVRALYAELHDQKPEDHGVTRWYADRARKYAADRGWPGPGYWDDDEFENPDFEPAVTVPGTAAAIVAENAAWLTADGLHRDLAASRLGKSRFYVDRALREHPELAEAVNGR